MKKLIVLAAVAAGVAYVVKFKSDQVKAAATKVTGDPRVQSALATASEKAGPVAASVSSVGASAAAAVTDRLHKSDDLTPPAVPEEAVEVTTEKDPVSAPEFTDTETAESARSAEPGPTTESSRPDPLTAPLETLGDTEEPEGPPA